MMTTFYPPYHFGGDAVYVRALSRTLVEQGHTVQVVHCEDAYRLRGTPIRSDDQGRSAHPGLKVHRLHSRFGALSPLMTQQTGMPGLKSGALRRILDQPFDVIHYHNISLVGGPGVLAMGSAAVKLYTMHEHWLVCPMHVLWKNKTMPCDKPQCLGCCLRSGIPPQLWRYTGFLQRKLEHVDLMLAPSEFTAQRHRDGGITRPIQVLPLFADIDVPADRGPSASVDPPHFLYAGRLTRPKGALELLERFEHLPQYRLTVVGDGELRESLQGRFGALPHIQFVGHISRTELFRRFGETTALIVPSVGPETFGLVTIEAMAFGTPVIVREAGGSGDPVRATGGGVVYTNGDELLQALDRMARDSDWRASLSRNGRAGYEQRYTPQAHLKEYLRLIQTIQASKQV